MIERNDSNKLAFFSARVAIGHCPLAYCFKQTMTFNKYKQRFIHHH